MTTKYLFFKAKANTKVDGVYVPRGTVLKVEVQDQKSLPLGIHSRIGFSLRQILEDTYEGKTTKYPFKKKEKNNE